GQLTASNIHAFICFDTYACYDTIPLGTYYFANAGDGTAGGASFTVDASGIGPNDSANWSGLTYFNTSVNYWTGRDSGGTSTTWGSGGWGMNNGSNSEYGNSNNTNISRWAANNSGGLSSAKIICIVNP